MMGRTSRPIPLRRSAITATLRDMAEEPENIVLEHLRAIRADTAALRHDVREIKKTQAAMLQVLASHETRLQHVEDRLERIEQRLGLVDADH